MSRIKAETIALSLMLQKKIKAENPIPLPYLKTTNDKPKNRAICNGHFKTEDQMLGYLNSMVRPINVISILKDITDGKWKCYYQYLD